MAKKILVVDNEEDILATVKTALESNNYTVITAKSGKECLEKLEEKPDLILLDVMMPEMSGWDVYQKIKKRKLNVRVVFLTVLEASPKRKAELMSAGIVDYITKPFSPNALLETVRRILG